jgi:BCD family chlorophyll transporter-like MFS transporter
MKLSWVQIARLGLVQMCIGAVVVLTTSTLNRLMVVELALPALVPGLLVALHYGIQITRPNWGFRSDTRGNRTAFVIGGMAALSLGAFLAALAVVILPGAPVGGLVLSVGAYGLIGLGAGASGTSLLALLATAPGRRGIMGLSASWEDATTAQTSAALQAMRESGTALRIQAYQALHDIVFVPYFSGEESWSALGYPGPIAV